ncbi:MULTISPECIES: PilZ domain-containing protein [Clostridium]|uniref:PilZ domain-containing protein n=1 Tax=Clostridium TaxID=1485 RepID=UPI0008270166|nr:MULTISPECIES: PilZ domain-containing protein [Clostridium]PJI07338.1 PilZ domain-containing protein [Clostridium sp. CT7]
MALSSKSDISYKTYRFAKEKRSKKRKKINIEISYPRINDKSVYEKFTGEGPILESVDISETGICFKSKIMIHKGDFVSFLLQVGDNPSFWCTSYVRWTGCNDNSYIVGCEFVSLSLIQIRTIRDFIEED